MWAPKLPGEGATMYDTASAMRDVMLELGKFSIFPPKFFKNYSYKS